MKKKIAVLTSGWAVDYVLSILEGMRKACEENNTDLYVFSCYKFIEISGQPNTTTFTIFDLIDFKDYDGIVITPGLFNDDDMVRKYAAKILESKVPAVSIGQRLEGFHFVGSDNLSMGKELIHHIIKDHGARTFAYIGGPEGDFGAESSHTVFLSSVSSAGLDPEKVVLHSFHTDWTFNSSYAISQSIFEDESKIPNAVVCVNSSVAMAVSKVIVEHGYSVPDDVIVISFEDETMSTKIIPSLTTVTVNPELIGAAAIEILLERPAEISAKIVQASIFKRQSCGCKRRITPEQKVYSLGFVKELDREQRFASQLRYIEDIFLRNTTIESLCKDLQTNYEKRHMFEGPDFALLIDKRVVDNISITLNENNIFVSYSDKMQTFANIQNGVAVEQCAVKKSELLPENMKSDKSCLYLFLPVFIEKYVYGYYVAKNYTGLLLNKAAYNWTRNIGVCIEKYRQTSVYRRMSEKLQVLSTQDALSGLLNRAGLYSYGIDLFFENNQNNKTTEIIFVDINDMKYINDRFGHLQGDLAIKTVAEAISSTVSDNYISVRYGGDEFVILGSPKEDADYCFRIKQMIQDKALKMELPYELTASIGSKIFKPNETSLLNEAVSEVDKIMYKNKAEYHNSRK